MKYNIIIPASRENFLKECLDSIDTRYSNVYVLKDIKLNKDFTHDKITKSFPSGNSAADAFKNSIKYSIKLFQESNQEEMYFHLLEDDCLYFDGATKKIHKILSENKPDLLYMPIIDRMDGKFLNNILIENKVENLTYTKIREKNLILDTSSIIFKINKKNIGDFEWFYNKILPLSATIQGDYFLLKWLLSISNSSKILLRQLIISNIHSGQVSNSNILYEDSILTWKKVFRRVPNIKLNTNFINQYFILTIYYICKEQGIKTDLNNIPLALLKTLLKYKKLNIPMEEYKKIPFIKTDTLLYNMSNLDVHPNQKN